MPAARNDTVQPADINLALTQTNQNSRIGLHDLLKSVNDMSAPTMPLHRSNNNSDSSERITPLIPDPDRAVVVISHVSGGTGGAGGSGGREGGGGGVGEGPSFQATNMHVTIQKQSAEDREIINWTSPINFFPRQADILGARQPGTGDWLLQESRFKQWKAGEIRALWCRGMPGAGKTVLASIVVDDLQANLANEKVGVAVLYLDHRAIETQSPTNLLAALWHQLACERPVSSKVHNIYKKHHPRGTRPSLGEIDYVLHSVISDFHRVFIVVDALDEYPEGRRNTLLRNLWTLGPPVKLMLTSRPHISIDHVILNMESLEVRANEEDIRKYLEGQIRESDRLSRHIQKSPTLRELIEDKIVKRSDGMSIFTCWMRGLTHFAFRFLLAKLHIDSIVNKLNVAAVQDALNKLSSNLHGAYRDIVERIDRASEEERQLAWRTLSWVLNAKTPLRRPQLEAALAVEPDSTELDPNCQTDMDLIVSLCAGLVVIDKVDDKVRLIHYTTEIYLQDHVHTSLFPRPPSEITLTCFTYMSLTFKRFSHMLQHEFLLFTYNPFLHYTVEYCLVHARGDPEIKVTDSILSFLANCSVWWRLWNWKHGGRQSVPDRLRIATDFHLEVISKHIINEDGMGFVLQEAVARGVADEVGLLIQNGVDLEKDGGALLAAVVNNQPEMVGILLAHDFGKNSQRRHKSAAQQCQGESVEPDGAAALLNQYGVALYEASWRGNHTITDLLIKHGADVNADSGEYGTALGAAVWKGHHRVVGLLIEHGADVNAKSGEHSSLLQAALWQGQEGVARLLVELGADVNAKAGRYGSALGITAWNGLEETMKLLLEHGADINAEAWELGSMLQDVLWKRRDLEILERMGDHCGRYFEPAEDNTACSAS